MWEWHLGPRFSGEHEDAGLTVGLDGLRGLSQPEKFYYSVPEKLH